MPPKAEITKEKVLDAAFEIVRKQGLGALTARSVAQHLKCSTQPIYSAYGKMTDLKDDVYNLAVDYALTSMKEGVKDAANAPALNLAIGGLHFAKNEKQLFRTVYLSGHKKYDLSKEKFIGEEMMIAHLRLRGRLSTVEEGRLRQVLKKLMIYLIGLGTMINTSTMELSIEEATDLIRDMYEALLLQEGISRP
ncbi:TetR/AcrR family transcriptional regulator [Paenibacillus ginsengarvi]|uniref:TetR/AcrR family transcriptional regulator n=1 Tax=Paenibacillus ginsengarvi TaxID=400777 RepID=A0A3B0CFJ8_9BACL|nr:TetR/AcrR family transcriptional regulator [Paenibacillus ginsengarvi]